MADDNTLDQSEIEKLLKQASGEADSPPEDAADGPGEGSVATAPASAPSTAEPQGAGSQPGDGSMAAGDVDLLLAQAEQALASIGGELSDEMPEGASTYRLEEFRGAPASTETATLDLISDVELDLKIELGRTHMYLEDVLKLRQGSVVPLDKLAGDPVDIYVNGRLIARGEVLVLNDNFCVRVAELIAGKSVSA